MNKKLLRSLISITSVVGFATSIPFTVSACSMSKEPIELKCNTNIESIYQDLGTIVDDTPALDKEIYTDTHTKIKSGVTFTCEGLKEQTGLDINETTGVINGTLTNKPTNPEFKIKFTANVHGKQLEGYTNPFTVTVNPTNLVIDKALDPINANLDNEITSTIDISRLIKTDTGESVSGVTFTCDGLPNGLSINQSTGVISGTPTHIQESTSYIIKFSCTFKEIQLEGSTEINIQTNGPQSIVCSQIEDQSIVVNKSFSLGVADVKMVFDGGVQKSLSSSDIASYELVDDKGQSAGSTLPQGLSFNINNGSISGTVISPNLYAPTTYKIKITGSQRIGSVVGYSNTFTLSMKDNPLPETVYDIDENNVLKGFKEGVDLSQYDGICDTMQIPARVTSIKESAFVNELSPSSYESTIPTSITKLTFAKDSNCSIIYGNAFRAWTSLISIDLLQATNLSSLGNSDRGTVFGACGNLTSVKLPSNLNSMYKWTFSSCASLNNIVWNAWKGNTTIMEEAFGYISATGTVTVINPIDDNHNSAALLAYLKTKGLPDGWTVG